MVLSFPPPAAGRRQKPHPAGTDRRGESVEPGRIVPSCLGDHRQRRYSAEEACELSTIDQHCRAPREAQDKHRSGQVSAPEGAGRRWLLPELCAAD